MVFPLAVVAKPPGKDIRPSNWPIVENADEDVQLIECPFMGLSVRACTGCKKGISMQGSCRQGTPDA